MKQYLYLFFILLSFVHQEVQAQTIPVPTAQQEDLTITIYNQGRALIKDIRNVDFHTGVNRISFEDISDQVMPESVLLKADGVSVLEQNFNFDLLTQANLLKKSVGQTVEVEHTNPATGVVSHKQAELLSNNGGPVLKIDGKIEAQYPGRIIFKEVPKSLSAKPSLVFDVDATVAGVQKTEVSYLTGGLSWSADYVAELDASGLMALNGLVTLTNYTSVSYYNARLQLVAGDVNVISPRNFVGMSNNEGRRYKVAESMATMDTEAISGYYLYTLKRPTDILSNQTKQVSLLSGANIHTNKTYEYENLLNYHSESIFENAKPTMYLFFVNSQKNGLGEALPKGVVRVYQKDSSGRLIFVGEDSIDHTTKNQTVRLALGQDFDITAKGNRISYKKIDSYNSQAEFEVKISNAKTEPVIVRYKQYLPDGWRVLSESSKSQKETSNQIYWDVTVGAESETVLTFKIAVNSR